MIDGVNKHDLSEQPNPARASFSTTPDNSLPTPVDEAPIHLAGVPPADDGQKNADATKEDLSEHDLLHQLSTSAFEACWGTDMAEPRYCSYLQILGFKSPEMETTYLAVHSKTTLTGHKIFAVVNAIYFLYRIVNLSSGSNTIDTTALTIYFLCTLGALVVLSPFCCVYFTGQEVQLRQSLNRMSTGIGVLALSGWVAQYADIFHDQTDENCAEMFESAYVVGMLSSIGPAFALVMLRIPFLVCALGSLSMGSLVLSAGYFTNRSMGTYMVVPLMQVPECLLPRLLLTRMCCQVLMLYAIENSSRSTFVSEMSSAKLTNEIRQAASDKNLNIAFSAINHAAKRTMINSMFWAQEIQKCSDPTDTVKYATEIVNDTRHGIQMCKSVVLQSQIAAGTYKVQSQVVDIRAELQKAYASKPSLDISVAADVPIWVVLDMLLLRMVLDNVIDNAMMHGGVNGDVNLTIILSGGSLGFQVRNPPGKRHAQNLQLQKERGLNSLLNECRSNTKHLSKIGSDGSTMLGMSEVLLVAKCMHAEPSLLFAPESVIFSLWAPVEIATRPDSVPQMPEGMVYFLCNDDNISRRIGELILRQKCLGADMNQSQIVGGTYFEAMSLVTNVLAAGALHGNDKVICIIDQNLEYQDIKVLGTDITRSLINEGFTGLIFIRSANDDFESVGEYRQTGATGYIRKDMTVEDAAEDLARQYHVATMM